MDATSSQDGGRVMSSFRMEPLEMGSGCTTPARRREGCPGWRCSSSTRTSASPWAARSCCWATTGTRCAHVPRRCRPCVPLRRRWVAHGGTPVTWRSSHTHDCRLEPAAPFEPGPSDPHVDAQGRMPGCDRHSHILPRLRVMIACPS